MPQSAENSHPHRFVDALHFLSRFLTRPGSIGSIWPSSRQLGEAMIHEIPLQSGDVVVEYGPGTGPFTSVLRKFMPPGVEYIGIEYDKELHQNLVRRFPGMRFHHGSAEETPEILASHGLGKAKFVISGLPFANMPRPLQEAIFESTRAALSPDGTFRTFTYFFSNLNPGTAHFRQLADDHFGLQHRSRTILRNFPPARVLSYSRPVQREIDMNC